VVQSDEHAHACLPSGAFRYDFARLGPAHLAVVGEVPAGAHVLEIGCATGYMTAELARLGCDVSVVDVSPVAVAAAARYATQTLVHDLDAGRLPGTLGTFDRIVLADVLEHLRDPEAALADLRVLLKPHGRVVVSIPNVAFWRIRLSLARGRWAYTDQGILDRTHLHFYTRATLHELAAQAGYRVERVRAIGESFPFAWAFPGPLRKLKYKLDGLSLRVFPRLFGYQYVCALTPDTS
jgi:SAM-dependent methyltransferase